MTAVTHQLIALTSALWILTAYPNSVGIITAVVAIIAVMIGALTPDLDQPAANLWQRMLGARAISNFFQAFSGGHRHFTHSLLGIFCIGFGLRWLMTHLLITSLLPSAHIIWLAFMIGYSSHILADTFTDRGVPWLWPLPWHFELPPGPTAIRITTGSLVENIFLRSALVVVIFLLLQSHWAEFSAFFK